MTKKTLTIKDNRNGKIYEFDVKDGSCGPAVADLSSFYEKTGMFVTILALSLQLVANQRSRL